MGWIGNVFIIIGLWMVGNKDRKVFLYSIVGETVWVFYAINQKMYDLAFICVIFVLLAARNWFKWGDAKES